MLRSTFKRSVSFVLALALVLSLCPAMVFAAETQELISVQDTLFTTVAYGTDKAAAIAALPTTVSGTVRDNTPLVQAEPFSYDFEDEAQKEDWTLLSDQITFSDGKIQFANSTNIKAHVGPETLTDFVVQADLKITEAKPSSDVGIMLRVTGATNQGADSYYGYYVGFGKLDNGEDAREGNGIKTGYADTKWHENGRYPYEIDVTKAYTLKAVVYGDTVTTFIKEADADESAFVKICSETTGYTAGTVGLRSYKQSFWGDNFQVRALTQQDLTDCGIIPTVDVELPVAQWVCENYDGEVPGQYVFAGELDLGDTYTNPGNVTPMATVTVKGLPENVAQVHSVPFSQVTVQDAFWSTRQKQFICEVIPVAIANISKGTGGIPNFKRASEFLATKTGNYTTEDGTGYQGAIYVDSDVYKVVEAMAYCLQLDAQGDQEIIDGQAAIAAQLEEWIPWFVGSQEADGYLYTSYTLNQNSRMRFTGRSADMPVHTDGSLYDTVGTAEYDQKVNFSGNHELYCAGHFYEAAVAHYRATGDFRLLDVAVKNADLVVRTFGYNDDQVQAVPGHQEIELALVKLAAVCEEIGVANGIDYASKAAGYVEKAKFFLDERGKEHDGDRDHFGTYCQDDAPVADQRTAHGHCVRAQYLYTGMADVALLELAAGRENPYDTALKAIWADALNKTYIHGGIGIPSGEAFPAEFQLPNDNSYCETCSQISNAMWNQRMNLLYGDAKYADLIEKTLYNTIISCINFNGDRFFYQNRMQANSNFERSVWFGTACCPPNLMRTVAAIGGYIYAQDAEGNLTVNLYIGNSADLNVAGDIVNVSVESEMPWEGEASFTVNKGSDKAFAVRFRIPEWATYGNTIKVNGEEISAEPDEQGYVVIDRIWAAGDKVELSFPMEPEKIYSDERVTANEGLVAVRRGPVVYAVENIDNPGVDVTTATLAEDTTFTVGELTRLPGREGEDHYNIESIVPLTVNSSYTDLFGVEHDTELYMIPYYAWQNRGLSTMRIYLHEADSDFTNPLEYYATPTASWTSQYDNIGNLNDGSDARWSSYQSPINYNWVQYEFQGGCVSLKGTWVKWYHDGGGVKVPTGMRIEYWNGTEWKEVTGMTNGDKFPAKSEQYYGFDEIVTNKIRLYPTNPETAKEKAQPGIMEWRLDGEIVPGIQFAETTVYEAEKAVLTAPARISNNAAVSGGAFVGMIDNENATVTFTVNAPATGYYRVAVTYSGDVGFPNTAHKFITNGEEQIVEYSKATNWNQWFHSALTVKLNEGENTLVVTHAGIDKSFAQLDCIEITAVDPVENVIALIGDIGEVTLDSKADIDAAWAAYDALTDEQKALVTNVNTLLQAEHDYAIAVAEDYAAKAEAAAEAAEKAYEDALAALKEAEEQIAEDKTAVEEARKAAEEAKKAAEDAKAKAESAQTAAEAARKAAEEANAEAADKAVKAAEEAAKAAEESAKAAEYAAAAAEAAAETQKAQAAAEAAQKAAEEAAAAAKEAEEAAKAAEEAAKENKEAAEKAAEEAKKAQAAAELAVKKYEALTTVMLYSVDMNTAELTEHQLQVYSTAVDKAIDAIETAETAEQVDAALAELAAALEGIAAICPAGSFTDVDLNRWYHEGIDFMVAGGYMNGLTKTTFGPDVETTRGMLATLLYRIAGEPSVEGLENPFEDVAEDKYYTNAVIWAASLEIVSGRDAVTFDPNAAVSRQEMVTMLWRFVGRPETEATLEGYDDADSVGKFAQVAMAWAVDNGIISGVSATELAPAGTATRAQIAVMLARYLSK